MGSIQSQRGLRSQNANRMLTLFRKICFDGKNPKSLVPTMKTPETPVKSRVSGVLKGAVERSKCSKRHPLSRTRNQFAGNRTWVRIPPSPPELAVTSHCQLFLYRLLCTIFGTASGHTIHCICRSLLRVVIQVSVDVCCIRIGTMSQPYLDLFHCDIFTAVKQMPCPLSVQFFILVRIQSSSLLQQRKP